MTKSKALNILGVGVIAFSIAFPAFAADAVLQEPQVPIAPDPIIDTSQWGGFYAGLYGGYSWFDANAGALGEADDEATKFGGYTGYNFEFDNNVVTGVELNGGFANAQTSIADTTVEQDWDASLRARLGYAFEKSFLYSFAGVALTGVEARSIAGSDEQILTGFNLGAGLEHEIVDGITARVEYGFADYGSETFAPGGTAPNEIEFKEDSLNLGLGVKF
jgi:outer membrane immunogenic protein